MNSQVQTQQHRAARVDRDCPSGLERLINLASVTIKRQEHKFSDLEITDPSGSSLLFVVRDFLRLVETKHSIKKTIIYKIINYILLYILLNKAQASKSSIATIHLYSMQIILLSALTMSRSLTRAAKF
jgi:hypothetical protein